MYDLLKYFIDNNYFWILVLVGIGFGISHFLKIDIIKGFFNRNFQKQQSKQSIRRQQQQKKLQVVQNVQKNYFDLNKQLINQNNQYGSFLQQQILKQLCKNNNYFDILQRYNNTLTQKSKEILQLLYKIQKKQNDNFLDNFKAKKILSNSLQLYIYKIIFVLKNCKKQSQNIQLIFPQLQRQINVITKQTLQFLNLFTCSYGKLGNPLKQIYNSKQSQGIMFKIKENFKLQKSSMILKTLNQLSQYKQLILNYVEKF